jgi:hypothetical protein
VEANCHFLESPKAKPGVPQAAGGLSTQGHPGWQPTSALAEQSAGRREGFGAPGALRAAKWLETNDQGAARQVPLYCFRLGKCGTFKPLSRVRGGSRIAVVWTLFAVVFSAVSSIRGNILFASPVVSLAADCA